MKCIRSRGAICYNPKKKGIYGMIIDCEGDIFRSEVEVLVNPVNCDGMMDRGLAAEFRRRFPEYSDRYIKLCRFGLLRPGKVFPMEVKEKPKRSYFLQTSGTPGKPTTTKTEPKKVVIPKFIVNFPTIYHARDLARIDDIQAGLDSMKEFMQFGNIVSIAIPALGCGQGGLDWSEVKPLIVSSLESLPETTVYLYPPIVEAKR
jgi:O-acetyl-ADP-ribose deacetylase (regulator of RNase III)